MSCIAIQRIVAFIPAEQIAVQAAPQGIIPTAAHQCVETFAAIEYIIAVERDRDRGIITIEVIVPIVAEQRIITAVAIKLVGIRAAE